MNPQQLPPTSSDTPPVSQFDFIMNPSQPQRKAPGGNSTAMRVLVIVVGIFILMIIAAIFLNALGGGKGANKAQLISVAQDQTELIRLADVGIESSVNQTNLNFATNLKLATNSQRSEFLTYLGSKGIKPKEEELALKLNAEANSQLTSAKSSSTFDVAYKSVMKSLLANYQRDLNAAYGDADEAGKIILKQNFEATQLLLTQADLL